MPRRLRAALFTPALVVALAACTAGAATVDAAEIETQALEQFSAQFPVDAVDCPDDLLAEVGATIECTLESEGSTFVMETTVESVDGDDAALNFELTEEL